MTKKGKDQKDIIDMVAKKVDDDPPESLTHPPDYIRIFSEYAFSSASPTVFCAEMYYGRSEGEETESKQDDIWALVAFSHVIQEFLSICSSMSESNIATCRKKLRVCESFADYHTRYQILVRKIPTASISKIADASHAIRMAHVHAGNDAVQLSSMADRIKNVDSIRDVRSFVKSISAKVARNGSTTEQAHAVRKVIVRKDWAKTFEGGKKPVISLVNL